MKITQIEPQKKNPKRFNVYLDGQFAFGADENLIVDYRLIPGKILDKSLLDKLVSEAEIGKLMERMYRLFSIRQRSEREIRNYFKLKKIEGISELIIDLLIEKLKQKNLINDLRFAKSWVEARRRTRQKGIRALRSELYQKGIAREIIEEVARVESLESSEEEVAKQALEKKMRVWKGLPHVEFKKKAYEFLTRKGFEYDVVKDIVEKMVDKR